AVVLAGHADGVRGGQEAVAHRVVHERVVEEARRHLGAAGLAHPLHVSEVGAAVQELRRTRQHGGQVAGVELESVLGLAVMDQFSRACTREAAISGTFTAFWSCLSTTTRVPSRPPDLRLASFTDSPDWLSACTYQYATQAILDPATVFFLVELRGLVTAA